MDVYPPQYIEHNLPFVVLSGLGETPSYDSGYEPHPLLKGHGIEIDSAVPVVTGERVDHLRQEFLSADARDAPWNNLRIRTRGDHVGFRLKAVGRGYVLPPRKAQPPQISPDETPPGSPLPANGQRWVLHSPISPLSPGSPTFPDGVMTPLWIAKHQNHIPSVFISFFDFTSEPGRDTLNDNQLKAEINRIKAIFHSSGYKTHYAVVLMSDRSIFEAPDIEERLANIRRTTGLDPKNALFFLPANTSRAELAAFVQSVLTTLQPLCVEYYRDLSKHARRKKNRNSVPAPTAAPTRGASHPLSGPGWSVRYDFKLGVFAEFRQEMDAACRHYSFAIDALLDGDGVFETTASWSPRWDDTRLLADGIAIRIVRCLMWNNGPTSAVQSWQNYKDRMRDLLDRRGKGTANYGWQAWESRWARVMAEIIQRVDPPIFAIVGSPEFPDALPERKAIYSPPEKAFPVGERLAPWHLVHHPGYWFRVSAERAIARRRLAEELPEEDRLPPGMSPATKVANRFATYDTYLVPEPHVEYPIPDKGGEGFDHTGEVVDLFNKAVGEFHARGQQRFVDKLQLDMGKELIHAARYSDALSALKPLWEGMSWRNERWWTLVSDVAWALNDCAEKCSDEESFLVTEFELQSRLLRLKQGKTYDFMTCLDSFAQAEGAEKPRVTLRAQDVLSCISITAEFAVVEGHVAEPILTQIAVRSNAHKGSKPITLDNLTVAFTGSLGSIKLQHQQNESGPSPLTELTLAEDEEHKAGNIPSFKGSADLTFSAGEVRVFTFPITFKEAGEVYVESATFEIETDRFHLTYTAESPQENTEPIWWVMGKNDLKTKRLGRIMDDPAIKVLPKPPKMEIRLPNLQKRYYATEPIILELEIENGEDEEAETALEFVLTDQQKNPLEFRWLVSDADAASEEEQSDKSGHAIGKMEPGAKRTQSIRLTAPIDSGEVLFEAKVIYHVISDPDVPISKTIVGELAIIDPFEATYDFTPQVHPDPWPSFFHIDDTQLPEASTDPATVRAFGLTARYLMNVRIGSYAEEELVIHDADLTIHEIAGGAIASVTKKTVGEAEVDIAPQAVQLRTFCVDVQKIALEDRRSSALATSISVTWRRKKPMSQHPEASSSVRSVIANPRLIAANSEPRVLASARPSTQLPTLIHLDYTLENPTMHFLTFDVSMEASEEFAFSGPKLTALHVLPHSRQTVRYNVLPLVKGAWIYPQLRVQDRYFNKILKPAPTEGMRQDKRGIAVWADVAEEENGEK
ncbi:Trafficking protein particle complex subunit 11 [Lasiodiplodia hormozganensis]|uniref:Trafficking protein particle complex subunit 11 n=1 Tax=Lasiodiplodia hormozganensis TaxID=869390 RepID=A0AA40CR89_9PEZI|nr:Trafficking protein particle complex subunit 11 [Lasiodiplodia hormozganensis]